MSAGASTKKLRRLCEKAGIRLEECDNGHYKIHGGVLVNYWPESKMRTAYIVGQKTMRHVTPEDVMLLAGTPKPKPVKEPERYTPKPPGEPDEALMEAAKSIQRKHGLIV